MATKEARITSEVAAAATVLVEHDWLVDEDVICGTCGEEFEPGQQVLNVRSPVYDGMVEDIHLRCYQGEEVRP